MKRHRGGRWFIAAKINNIKSRTEYQKLCHEFREYLEAMASSGEIASGITVVNNNNINGETLFLYNIVNNCNYLAAEKLIVNSEEYDPYSWTNMALVSAHNQDEIELLDDYLKKPFKSYWVHDKEVNFMYILNTLYTKYGFNCFNELEDLHFSTVFYDEDKKIFVGAKTISSNEYDRLYYGYINNNNNNNVMYSNNPDIIKHFCLNIYEVEDNTMIINDSIVSFYNPNYIKKSRLTMEDIEKEVSRDYNAYKCRQAVKRYFKE